MEHGLLITAAEAGTLLALSRSKVYDLVASGQLESVRIGRAVRIRYDVLCSFVEDLAA